MTALRPGPAVSLIGHKGKVMRTETTLLAAGMVVALILPRVLASRRGRLSLHVWAVGALSALIGATGLLALKPSTAPLVVSYVPFLSNRFVAAGAVLIGFALAILGKVLSNLRQNKLPPP